jgi:hypothetical protein
LGNPERLEAPGDERTDAIPVSEYSPAPMA